LGDSSVGAYRLVKSMTQFTTESSPRSSRCNTRRTKNVSPAATITRASSRISTTVACSTAPSSRRSRAAASRVSGEFGGLLAEHLRRATDRVRRRVHVDGERGSEERSACRSALIASHSDSSPLSNRWTARRVTPRPASRPLSPAGPVCATVSGDQRESGMSSHALRTHRGLLRQSLPRHLGGCARPSFGTLIRSARNLPTRNDHRRNASSA
jgi:hypothetical protein